MVAMEAKWRVGLLGLTVVFGLFGPATAQEKSDELTEKQRIEYAEKLRHWEETRERLFDQLVEAIEAEDRVEAYYVLKRLHGGGAGADGSEFELRREEVSKHRRTLRGLEKKLDRMKRAENVTRMGQGTEKGKRTDESYWQGRRVLEEKIAYQLDAIERLEAEALEHAEAAILTELPLIFEILSGGSLSEEQTDPFSTDSTAESGGH